MIQRASITQITKWRENEVAVRKINLTHGELDSLRSVVRRFDAAADDVTTVEQTATVEIVEPDALAELARRIFDARLKRQRHFPGGIFGEPAWEMLLVLYTHESDRRRLSVSQLTSFSGSPPTTGLRWLDYLADQRLVIRVPHPRDRRVQFVELSEKGRSALNQYLAEVRVLLG